MPGISRVVSKFAKQTMLYWEKVDSDEFGDPVYKDPVTVKCRWEDSVTEVITNEGRKVTAHAYTLLTQYLVPGSWVFLGGGKNPMADWKALPGYPETPTQVQGGREVLVCRTTPDLKAKDSIYEARF
jgi:hypothetical protein